MSLSLLALVVLSQTQEPTPTPFTVPMTVADPIRLQLTPVIDGKLESEEWDPLTVVGDSSTYLQWEPDALHVASMGPVGSDLLVSIDVKGDGWLVGKDNVEVRVSPRSDGTGADVVARNLDCSNPAGPVWRPLPGFKLSSKAAITMGTQRTTEVTIHDGGLGLLPGKNQKVSIRVDLVPAASAQTEPYLPRVLTPISFTQTRSAALPTGLRWNVERNDVPLVPGEGGFFRLTFNGDDKLGLKRAELRSEGLVQQTAQTLGVPFPKFDKKGRAFLDYSPLIPAGTETGYRVMRATITGADGVPGVAQVSYRLAPLVDVDLIREIIPMSDKDRGMKLAFYLESNSKMRIKGDLEITVPPGFRILNGQEKQKLNLSDTRSRLRKSVDMFVPANAVGCFPIEFKLKIGGSDRVQTCYLNIG